MKQPANFSKVLMLGIASLIIITGFVLVYLNILSTSQRLLRVETMFSQIKTDQQNLKDNLSEDLFQDHLKVVDNIVLSSKLKEVDDSLQTMTTTKDAVLLSDINSVYQLYQDFQKKLERNKQVKIQNDITSSDIDAWGKYLLDKDLDALESSISAKSKALDEAYDKYVASLPKQVPVSGGGYSYITVDTEKGKFGMYLIKVAKSSVTVKTIAAIETDCKRDCPTKSLAQYMQENNAFAGMTGSYACPADYPQCADKKWSFDFALYDSNDHKWFNKSALTWNKTGMMTFSGSSSKFYADTSDYGVGSVTAAVSNFPSLVRNGNIVVDSGDIDSYQKVKGLRGVLGTDDKNIYLAYISNASVIDAAYAIRSAGAKDALNLDGGGTAAMYVNGGYVVGPGRPLANAVLLIK